MNDLSKKNPGPIIRTHWPMNSERVIPEHYINSLKTYLSDIPEDRSLWIIAYSKRYFRSKKYFLSELPKDCSLPTAIEWLIDELNDWVKRQNSINQAMAKIRDWTTLVGNLRNHILNN